ncbi:DUF4296 domain-containing protein [Faecalibacter rhinopitheci]|uniref:DUF4296 domain-containing protein n=1 Tax=Faecalibacter rhinopitheci TaxID=2779678 RepID=A0A8J7K429_9FLAO|nr:DUF4296 domain-containing protein [Faecalibacter rhinopitheci]MBF0596914.1 DUF4296 domain-containing protein [Faecalibacter rhinopitheci]
MRKIFYIFIVSISLSSCSRPYIDTPDNLISKSDMVDILVDIYKSQQMINNTQSSNQILSIAEGTLYIFENHDVTRQEFEESYKYYFTQPRVYQKILDQVRDDLYDQLSDDEKARISELQVE